MIFEQQIAARVQQLKGSGKVSVLHDEGRFTGEIADVEEYGFYLLADTIPEMQRKGKRVAEIYLLYRKVEEILPL